jgi:hypothetical protein
MGPSLELEAVRPRVMWQVAPAARSLVVEEAMVQSLVVSARV